jgi:hypothetical protein
MQFDIEKLSMDELMTLNRRVVERIQYLHSLNTRTQLDRFDVGDRVSFQSDGRAVEGIVVRVNRKTLSIHTEHSHWNIHPKFLTKVSGDASKLPQDIRNLMQGKQ